jgi:prolyl oligopeptidase
MRAGYALLAGRFGLALILCGACSSHSTRAAESLSAEPDDVSYLWLEELSSDTVLSWAEARRMQTLERFAALPIYDSLVAEIRSARTASRLIPLGNVPSPAFATGPFANVFSDRGWARQPADRHAAGATAWQMAVDLDSLSRAEGGRYRLGPESLECLPPEYERCLLLLARDGRSSRGLREVDAGRNEFVADGFNVREGRTSAFWKDLNSVYITTKPMGAADDARIWRRGQSLDDARVIFTAGPSDRGVSFERKGSRLLLLHSYDQYTIDYYLVQDDELVQLPVPRDAREIAFIDGRMVLQLRSGWKPADVAFPSGSLIGIDLQQFLGGSKNFDLIMSSDRDLVVDVIWTTRSLLLVRALADMKVRLFEFSNREGPWERRRIDVPEDGNVWVRNVSPESDTYYFTHEDFLSPRTAYRRSESGQVQVGARTAPAFSADPYEVDRRFATSADGTRIPYFIVHRRDMPLNGRNPVIVRGYGGNGISILPYYLSLYGPTWLSRGGVYVLANIRGGNEYGPEWHAAVRREKRQRAYDDFQAVARDLIDRKVTSPKLIGAEGASNGGILVSTSFIQRPDLYGAVWSNNGVLELQRCSSASGDPPVGERGDGQDPDDWAYMRNYSPFHNLVEGQPYPPLLLTANRADDVVHPCHSRKFTAKLEDLGYRDVLYYETEEGGHGKGYTEEEEAMIIGFFLQSLHPEYR